MWPVFFRVLRQYAPAITLPFAAIIGIIGYNLENLLSDKYTPYNDAIKDKRGDRLLSEETLKNATDVETLKYTANVFERNLPPSLRPTESR